MDRNLIDFIDAHRIQPARIGQKFSSAAHRSMDLTGLRLVLNTHLSSLPNCIADRDRYILGKLRYKLAAAHRHHKFWQIARRIGGKLANMSRPPLQSLRWFADSIQLAADDTLYAPSIAAFAYGIGQLLQLAIELMRIIELCRICARESVAQLRHEHLVGVNLILIGTVASVHRSAADYLIAIGKLYDAIGKWHSLVNDRQQLPTSFVQCGSRLAETLAMCNLRANSKQRQVHFQFISQLLKTDERAFVLKSNMQQLESKYQMTVDEQIGVVVDQKRLLFDD